jgi:hypothetical protein
LCFYCGTKPHTNYGVLRIPTLSWTNNKVASHHIHNTDVLVDYFYLIDLCDQCIQTGATWILTNEVQDIAVLQLSFWLVSITDLVGSDA